jgi:hypothetical protein
VLALGEELVLWRDSCGRAHIMRDRCPHRDIRLSLGVVRLRRFFQRELARQQAIYTPQSAAAAVEEPSADVPALPLRALERIGA